VEASGRTNGMPKIMPAKTPPSSVMRHRVIRWQRGHSSAITPVTPMTSPGPNEVLFPPPRSFDVAPRLNSESL
jgi:hypothetical protein